MPLSDTINPHDRLGALCDDMTSTCEVLYQRGSYFYLLWFGCLSDCSSWPGLARIVNAVRVNECVCLLHPVNFIFVNVLFEAL